MIKLAGSNEFSGACGNVFLFRFTARAYASVVLGFVILSVYLSVGRLSVTRVLCDKTKQCTVDILIPLERAIVLVF